MAMDLNKLDAAYENLKAAHVRYERAKEQHEAARSAERSTSCEVSNAKTAWENAKKQLDTLIEPPSKPFEMR